VDLYLNGLGCAHLLWDVLPVASVQMHGKWLHVRNCQLSARAAWLKVCPSCPEQCLHFSSQPTLNSCAS